MPSSPDGKPARSPETADFFRAIPATPRDLPVLYERMFRERLLARVVQGEGTYAEFAEIAGKNVLYLESDPQSGETCGFWWVTHFYARAVVFHCCLFRGHRRHAHTIFHSIRDRLFAAGVTDIFFCTQNRHRDLARFCASEKLTRITTLDKEITVWAATAAS